MSNRKKRKNRERAAIWHKAASREHVGVVPATKVLPDRRHKGGGRRRIDVSNVSLNGVPLEDLIKTDEEVEATQGSPASSLVVRPYVPTKASQPKHTFRTQVGTSPYSAEIQAHFNYLVRAEGERAAHEYLNSIRSQSVSSPVINFNNNNTGQGPLEKALQEAEDKVKFYTKQALQAEQESTRWILIRDQLKEVLNLATGRTNPTSAHAVKEKSTEPSSHGGARKTRHSWGDLIEEIMKENPAGIKKNALKHKLDEKTGDAGGNAYNGITAAIRNGSVVEIDGKLYWSASLEKETEVK